MRYIITLIAAAFTIATLQAQPLKPGFDKKEYIQLLRVTARQVDTPWNEKAVSMPLPDDFKFTYRSPIAGLDNLWDLWLDAKTKTAVLSIRGTTANSVSWLENFYAAMVPATGTLQLSNNQTFTYKLAAGNKAAVHAGWLLGMAVLSNDVLRKTDSCYKAGYRNFIIMGHSQGGAIAYLMRSYFAQMQTEGKLPKDILLKTYCSAAPKPGNLYYAYDYELLTANGWGISVWNTDDWVPETPLSLQTLYDFNTVNPFTNAGEMLGAQKFPKNIVLKLVYNRLRKPGERLQRRYKKYLGHQAYKLVAKQMTEYKEPGFSRSSNYMRTGTPVILMPDADYYKKYPNNEKQIFVHHFPGAYLFIAERLKD